MVSCLPLLLCPLSVPPPLLVPYSCTPQFSLPWHLHKPVPVSDTVQSAMADRSKAASGKEILTLKGDEGKLDQVLNVCGHFQVQAAAHFEYERSDVVSDGSVFKLGITLPPPDMGILGTCAPSLCALEMPSFHAQMSTPSHS